MRASFRFVGRALRLPRFGTWLTLCIRGRSADSWDVPSCTDRSNARQAERPPDKPEPRRHISGSALLSVVLLALLLVGCDHSPFNQTERAMDQADQKQASQDYRGAVACYERALDGSPKSAEAHFRLGILYDEKLNDPVSAVHHFRRYLDVAPSGTHAREAKANLERLELTLATSLSGGTFISHAEALRLRAENTDLRKQLAARPAALDYAEALKSGTDAGKAAARDAQKKPAPGSRTYVVQPGDTFASISRKFYKTKARAADIQDANLNTVPNPKKLRAGQTLIIP